jgi:hypothetical protein
VALESYGWEVFVLVNWSCLRQMTVVRRAPGLVGKTCRTPGSSSSVTVSIFFLPLHFAMYPHEFMGDVEGQTGLLAGYPSQRRQYKSFSRAPKSHGRLPTDGPLVVIRHTCRRKKPVPSSPTIAVFNIANSTMLGKPIAIR